VRTIEGSVAAGRPVIVENIRKTLHPELISLILTYNFYGKKEDASLINFGTLPSLRKLTILGGKDIQFNEGFRLHILSPHRTLDLPEEIRSKLNVVDFSLARMGLEDILLGLVVRQERSDIQQQKDTLVERILSDLKYVFSIFLLVTC
jgi:dynein heavy chain